MLPAMMTRIKLHWRCLQRGGKGVRFHIMGILRELVPRPWQKFVR